MRKKRKHRFILEELKELGVTAVIIENKFYVSLNELVKKARKLNEKVEA